MEKRTNGERGLWIGLAVLTGVLGFLLGRFSASPEPLASNDPRARGSTSREPESTPRNTPLSGSDPADSPHARGESRDEARTNVAAQDEPGARLEGFVVDENGARVADALLLLGEDPVYPLADAREIGHSRADGSLELARHLLPSERHVAAHLFALSQGRLGWVQFAVPENVELVHVGDVRLARSAHVEALLVDDQRVPLAGVEVQARARFYPVSGLFDAIRDADNAERFQPHAQVLELFRARSDENGRALFEHLPAPFSAGLYELVVDDARAGKGSADVEQPGASAQESLVIRVRRPR